MGCVAVMPNPAPIGSGFGNRGLEPLQCPRRTDLPLSFLFVLYGTMSPQNIPRKAVCLYTSAQRIGPRPLGGVGYE